MGGLGGPGHRWRPWHPPRRDIGAALRLADRIHGGWGTGFPAGAPGIATDRPLGARRTGAGAAVREGRGLCHHGTAVLSADPERRDRSDGGVRSRLALRRGLTGRCRRVRRDRRHRRGDADLVLGAVHPHGKARAHAVRPRCRYRAGRTARRAAAGAAHPHAGLCLHRRGDDLVRHERPGRVGSDIHHARTGAVIG